MLILRTGFRQQVCFYCRLLQKLVHIRKQDVIGLCVYYSFLRDFFSVLSSVIDFRFICAYDILHIIIIDYLFAFDLI